MFGQNFQSNVYTNDDNNLQMFTSEAVTPDFDPNDFLNTDLLSSPAPHKAQINFQSPLPQFQPRSVVSSASPESSTQDSSSDSSGRRKRKSPSGSSLGHGMGNGWEGGDMMDFEREKRRTKVDSLILKQEDAGMGMLNNSMTESFNIKSAANSPPAAANTSSSAKWNLGTPTSLTDQDYNMAPVLSRSPAPFGFGGSSRDNTPPSAVSFDSNHTPFLMMRDSPDMDALSFSGPTSFGTMGDAFSMFNSPPPPIQTTTNMSTIRPVDIGRTQLRFHVSPLGHKSRVETQIPIKLTLDPLPPGVKRIHLPTETIAKAKFLAKETPRLPDSLELSAMLVCSSAMENPSKKAHALHIAREGSHLGRGINPRRSSTGDTKKSSEVDPNDPDSPANGGPVRICDNCVSRERKRAGRKKAKKQEDEERWHDFEHDRIIMFNTQEYLDFHPPTPAKEPQYIENVSFSPEAMQVDAPMRIVCYCRHQQEKIGFQVIFTIKDWQGRIVAQSISQSILITDDHKTHAQSGSIGGLAVSDNPPYNPGFIVSPTSSIQPPGLPGRAYHSSTNLAALNGGQNFWNTTKNTSQSKTPSSMTPRNLSRPASPSNYNGPKKKRKGSGGQPKIPASLMMTRSEIEPLTAPPVGVTSTSQMSMLSPDAGTLKFDTHAVFGHNHYNNTTPPTPEAIITGPESRNVDNYFFSAPNSAHPSRAASPVSFARQSMNMFPNHPSLSNNVPFVTRYTPEGASPPPNILKIRPDRGPVTGNIEVVILGKNFHRNLEVKFGDNTATTTTYWNADTLVCLLPPTIRAGAVPVTFVSSNRPGYSPPAMSSPPMFTYIDDTKQQLFELAIQLQCAAQLGPNGDPLRFAQDILATQGPNPFSGGQSNGYNGNMLASSNTEELILSLINKVDLIDSPFMPFYDHKQEGGSTMLALACRLGYERLVAGLLARGADPDAADAGGFTPLMHAAFNGHIAIVRRLILRGADPGLRNLRGMMASELASTPEVRHYVRHRRHYRSMSAGTPYFRSRANSAASTRSLWGPPSSSASSTMYTTDNESAVDEEDGVEDIAPIPRSAMASRRPSLAVLRSRRGSEVVPMSSNAMVPSTNSEGEAAMSYGVASTMASLSALRDQLTAQINALQQNLPSMQFSDLLPEQNLPALGRRFSALVPMRRDASARADNPSADPPPSYYEACPDGVNNDFDTKPPEIFEVTTVESSTIASLATLRPTQSAQLRERTRVTIGKTSPLGVEAAELRRIREEKLTPAKQDRKLWSIWFPILILLVIWYLSGLHVPPFPSWLKSFNDIVTETVGKSLPALPSIPERLRYTAAG